jgi:hypothetical protein
MTLTEYFEEQFRPGLREGNVAKLVDDEQFDGGELSLKFQETPLIARFHKLMNQPRRGVEGNRETTLAGRAPGRGSRCARTSEDAPDPGKQQAGAGFSVANNRPRRGERSWETTAMASPGGVIQRCRRAVNNLPSWGDLP